MEMVRIPAGSYTVYRVRSSGAINPFPKTISTAFYIGKYEVTQAQYQAVMGTNPSSFTSGADAGEVQNRRPVENVTWYDAVEFCNKLSDLEGLTKVYTITSRTPTTGYPITNATVTQNMSNNGYRLPTEIEWMYALPTYYLNNQQNVWSSLNSNSKTHEVGKKLSTKNGLYDMLGNVQEWVWDWFEDYNGDQTTDPVGPSSGTNKVHHGGYYNQNPLATNYIGIMTFDRVYYSNSASYDNDYNRTAPNSKNSYTGFRVVRR